MKDFLRDSVHRLSRLCAEMPEVPETKKGLTLNPTGGVLIREDTMERRWLARNRPNRAAVPPLANARIAFDLQLHRAAVAANSAAITYGTATGTDKNVFDGLAQCAGAARQLRGRAAALDENAPPTDVAWQDLADEAYSLGKAMNAAMLRLQVRSCLVIVTDLATRTRGAFQQQEVYALTKVMEHLPHHDLPCVQIQNLLQSAHQRSRGKVRGADADLAPWLSESERQSLRDFLDNPLVSAVLEDLQDHKLCEVEKAPDSFAGFDLVPEAVGLHKLTLSESQSITPRMRRLVDLHNAEIQNKHEIFMKSQDRLYRSRKWDVDAYLRSEEGQLNAQEWDESQHRLATATLKPYEYARFMASSSLRRHLMDCAALRSLGCMRELFSDGLRLTVPEALLQGVKTLQATAARKQMPPRLLERLLTLRSEIDAVYREATGHDRLALELEFVLKVANQNTMGSLRDRLADLTKIIEGRPKLPAVRAPTRAQTEPTPSPAPSASASDSDVEVDADAEAGPEAEATSASAPASAAPKAVPVMWNNKPTPLRTRLGNDEVLQLIDHCMAAGTLGTPLRSAIYHYRRHVLRNAGPQPSGAKSVPNVTIEDYIYAALRRSKDWDGHTVTRARSGGHERLALVESRPRGWFTMDGRVVSYCFEDA